MTYNKFMQDNGFNNSQGATRTQNNPRQQTSTPATREQIKYYNDLCKRKGHAPVSDDELTRSFATSEIARLREIADPISDGQRDKILQIQATIESIKDNFNGDLNSLTQEELLVYTEFTPLTLDEVNALTGGKGTASTYLTKLFATEKALEGIAPISERQIEELTKWFLCPDIPFENYGISKRVTIDADRGLWRLITPEEFATQLKQKMTAEDAKRLRQRHASEFYNWSNSRISNEQVELIQTMEERLANLFVPGSVEYAYEGGELVQTTTRPNRQEYNPNGYARTEEYQLRQLSKDDASAWLDRLQMEVARGNDIDTVYVEEHPDGRMIEVEGNEEEFNDSTRQDLFEEERTTRPMDNRGTPELNAKANEVEDLQDLIYSFESLLGYECPEIHDLINEVVIDTIEDEATKPYRDMIREFFLDTVTIQPGGSDEREERRKKQFQRVHGMCQTVPTALYILTGQWQ